LSNLVTLGCVAAPTISNACSSGTPAFIMVASWRVKKAMSLGLIFLPERMRRFLILVGEPLAPQHGLHLIFANGTSLTPHYLAVAVLAFPLKDEVLDIAFGCFAVAMVLPRS
jgi:hypothetical protein